MLVLASVFGQSTSATQSTACTLAPAQNTEKSEHFAHFEVGKFAGRSRFFRGRGHSGVQCVTCGRQLCYIVIALRLRFGQSGNMSWQGAPSRYF